MPIFDGKSKNIELFENMFQTRWKIHNHFTEEDKKTTSTLSCVVMPYQQFKNIKCLNRNFLGGILSVFGQKNIKFQSMTRATHKNHGQVLHPANPNLVDFPGELQKLAKNVFGVATQAIIEHFIYAKMVPHLKKSINKVPLENGRYKQFSDKSSQWPVWKTVSNSHI